ncbi:MAG TPA: MFS transporter [SAR86 cluster bacterium]|jgi:MFS family permease|nr:MFS transporter [SAR86 cluster bacterium]HJM15246.1 MFS transporter [SAR86 cluster bacterium]|tara:strand:+ start:6326 stop:7567 length:1242 start_codon:yes stop_codon:yes gene_type:complete
MNLKSTEALKEDSKILYSLMLIIIFVSMGQSVYWQTMPIIGREFGFSEMEINTVVSISAAMFIIFTPFWGRLSDRIGRKSVLLVGLTGYVLSNIIFLYSASIGLLGYVSGFFLLFILLVSRIINSAVGAASRPATGAYVADVTSLEERSSGMGKFGAANNIGTILGPVLVGSIIGINIFNSKIDGFALLTPLIVMSFLMIVAIFFVLLFLPNKKSADSDEMSSERPALDKNLKLLISIGVIVFTSFAIVQSVTAYYVQDRFSLTLDETARSTALLLGTMALMAIVSQLTLVQRFKGPPLELIKYSIPLFVLSSLIIVFSPSYTYIYFGMAIMGLAMGLASPGYTAAASLNADPNNQGAAVGLAMVAPGLGFTLGPFLSGLLYSISINLPFLFILPLFLVILFILPKLNSITTS